MTRLPLPPKTKVTRSPEGTYNAVAYGAVCIGVGHGKTLQEALDNAIADYQSDNPTIDKRQKFHRTSS